MSSVKTKKRRWLRFSLRTLLTATLIVGIGFAWIASKLHQVRERRAVVAEIEKLGGTVLYHHELDEEGNVDPGEFVNGQFVPHPTPGPAWLKQILGQDFFVSVAHLDLGYTAITDDIKRLCWVDHIVRNPRCWNETGICALDISASAPAENWPRSPGAWSVPPQSKLCIFDPETETITTLAEEWLSTNEVVVLKEIASYWRRELWSYDVRTGEGKCVFAFGQPGD